MKASELRLGNWIGVYLSESQVTEIDEGMLFFDFIKYPDGLNFEYDYIGIEFAKPIPITEEWLIKFGFVEMEDVVPEGYPSYRPPTGQARIYYNELKGLCIWAVYRGLYVDDQIVIAELQYVHQLQNLYYALTRKELTIKIDYNMKATELRIGNYITEAHKENPEILEIDGELISILDKTDCRNVRGVPLTPEWMVKFGFVPVPSEDNDAVFFFRENSEISIGFYSGGVIRVEFNDVEIRQTLYVHQVQNLYFILEDVELTIKK